MRTPSGFGRTGFRKGPVALGALRTPSGLPENCGTLPSPQGVQVKVTHCAGQVSPTRSPWGHGHSTAQPGLRGPAPATPVHSRLAGCSVPAPTALTATLLLVASEHVLLLMEDPSSSFKAQLTVTSFREHSLPSLLVALALSGCPHGHENTWCRAAGDPCPAGQLPRAAVSLQLPLCFWHCRGTRALALPRGQAGSPVPGGAREAAAMQLWPPRPPERRD